MTLLESSRHGRKKPSAPLADYGLLPADIMFDVLLRLPAKELCRLRVVCQAWSSITQSPLFAKAHSSRHPLVLGLRNRSEVQFIDLSGNTVKKLATGACDLISPLELSSQLDLVCVSEITGPTCVVVNSATGAVTVLPRDIGIEQDINMGATHWHTGIIGQVPSIGEYKVLRFYFYHHHHQKKKNSGAIQACDVMTLHNKNGRWRARSPPRALFISTTSRDRVVVDGVAYFLLEHGVEPDAVASFDMATEEWRPMTLQGPVSRLVADGDHKLRFTEHRGSFHLSKLKGHLVMICFSRDSSTDLWFLEDTVNGLWTKRYSLRYVHLWDNQGFCYPLVVLDDGKIVFWVNKAKGLKAYDPRTNAWGELAMIQDYWPIVIHQGSLLCPNLQC